jgi:iron complex transport system substrate-binding protein
LRVVSLQPSISIVLQALGCLDLLVACTKYCVAAIPELSSLPVQVIHDSWSAKTEEILASKPDLVIASVPYRMESLAAILKAGVPVLTLAPHSLADVYADISLLGSIVRKTQAADAVIESMQAELEQIRVRATAAEQRPLVYCEEWGKPLIHSQAWVDELIEVAGGRTFRKPGVTTDESAARQADPDVLIFAWCGAGDRVPLEKIVEQRGWTGMRAVCDGRVYCINDDWLNTPAPNLLNGARAIAAALHPHIFSELQSPRAISSPVSSPISTR